MTEIEHDEIAAMLVEGLSRAEIGRRTGRGRSTIQKVANAIGYNAERKVADMTAKATECRKASAAERRAERAAKLADQVDRMLASLDEPHVAFSFGGKDNDYNEHRFDRPDVGAQRLIVQSIAEAERTMIAIERHDQAADEGGAALDRYLRSLIGDEVNR